MTLRMTVVPSSVFDQSPYERGLPGFKPCHGAIIMPNQTHRTHSTERYGQRDLKLEVAEKRNSMISYSVCTLQPEILEINQKI